jgi:hypothetical protein
MTKLSTKLKEEFFALLPPTIFFFVALHIVTFVRVLMLKGTGISPLSSISVAVAALILGKAVLIADMLPMINRFPNKPLIYNVAWKTLIYLLVATLIHYLERLIDFWRQGGRQQKAAGRNRVAAFLGYPDHSARADCYVLHDARTGARDWKGKGAADILRPDAHPASLSEAKEYNNENHTPLRPRAHGRGGFYNDRCSGDRRSASIVERNRGEEGNRRLRRTRDEGRFI